jgi:nucleoside-diphosphate-sugar epimerase
MSAVILQEFHSMLRREVHDAQKDLVDPAVKGTQNVLKAAVKSKATVKRVVLTSSFAGMARATCSPIQHTISNPAQIPG